MSGSPRRQPSKGRDADPSRFVYQVKYESDGEPYATEVRATMSGEASCEPVLQESFQVEHGKLANFTCERTEPEKTNVTVTLSADSGGGHLQPIELAAYEPVPPLKPVRECLKQGTAARVMFRNCGKWDNKNIFCSHEYVIQYNRRTAVWSMTGEKREGGYGTWTSKQSIAENWLSAWETRHRIEEDGRLHQSVADGKILRTGRVYCRATGD